MRSPVDWRARRSRSSRDATRRERPAAVVALPTSKRSLRHPPSQVLRSQVVRSTEACSRRRRSTMVRDRWSEARPGGAACLRGRGPMAHALGASMVRYSVAARPDAASCFGAPSHSSASGPLLAAHACCVGSTFESCSGPHGVCVGVPHAPRRRMTPCRTAGFRTGARLRRDHGRENSRGAERVRGRGGQRNVPTIEGFLDETRLEGALAAAGTVCAQQSARQ